MKNYTIEMRPTSNDNYESIESAYNRKLVRGKAVHTSRREAEKELHRLQRLVKAGNDLRKLEGNSERHYYQFRIVAAEDFRDMRAKVMATPDKIYKTSVYQYWINGSGNLCRARLEDLDTTAMLEDGAVEILDLPSKYRVRDEFIDAWYGSQSTDEIEAAQATGLDYSEIRRLAVEWGADVDDLMEQVEEI